jgi:hybrid cluster-associated redox disulfide protein
MDRITKDTHVDQIVTQYPSLSRTFIEFRLPCLACGEAFWGPVEELGQQHGVNIEKLVEKLNQKRQETDDKL